MMSSSSAFIGPGDFVYVCPACNYVAEDVSKLRVNTGVGATIMLCCAKCTLFTEVKPVSRTEYFSTGLRGNQYPFCGGEAQSTLDTAPIAPRTSSANANANANASKLGLWKYRTIQEREEV